MRNTRTTLVNTTIALFMLASAAGCSDSESRGTLVAEAKHFMEKGDHKSAVIQLKNALVKNPADVDARIALGTAYTALGDGVSAEKEFRKAAELGAPAARYATDLANALLMQGQFQKVLDETETASPTAEMLAMRANALMGLGKPEAAQPLYEQALKVNPDLTSARLGLARIALVAQDIAAANKLADAASSASPNDASVWMFKASLARAQGKQNEAAAAYDQVLKVKPDHRSAWLEKAYLQISERKYVEAQESINASKKLDPNGLMLYYTQALLDHSQGKHALAKESLQKILRVAPEHMPSVLLAGAVERELGSIPQAEQHLRKYVEKVPGDNFARKMLVATLIQSGQPGDARAVLAPVLKDDVTDPQILMLAGELAMNAREFAKATAFLERAAKLAPDTAALRTSLAMSKLANDDNDGAISALYEAQRLDAKSTKAGTMLVLVHTRLKQYDKALAAVNDLAQRNPKDAVVHNLKGAVHLAMRDTKSARANFEKAMALDPAYFPPVANLAGLEKQDNKPERAKQYLTAFVEKNKGNTDAMVTLADLANAQGKPAEATQWLEKAEAENPQAVGPAVLLGSQYIRTGNHAKALTLARRVHVANPASPQILALLAQSQLATGDKTAALDSYSKLVAMDTKAPVPLYSRAIVYRELGKLSAAAGDLKKAIELNPGFVDAHLALADVLFRDDKAEQAIAVARKLQKQATTAAAGFRLEGTLYQAQNKPALAVRPLEQALALEPNSADQIRLHAALTKAGQEKDAAARMATWQKAAPDDLALQMYEADLMLSAKQFAQAIPVLENVVAKAPRNAVALNNLAWAYQQVKDPRAAKTAERALALAGDSPALLDTLGHILVGQGDVARGLEHLNKAVKLAPDEPMFRFHLAQGMVKAGDKQGARTQLDQVIAAKGFSQLAEAKALRAQL